MPRTKKVQDRANKEKEENKVGDKKEKDQEDIRIVYPGDVVIESLDVIPGQGVYRQGEKVISKFVGVVKQRGSVVNVVPLNGVYMPKPGDFVVGEIIDIGGNYWIVDINSPYDAFLGLFDTKEFIEKESDLTQYYEVGDLIFAKISKVTKTKYINVSLKDPQARKLGEGLVIHASPPKVPRIIGKGGSMIKIIKEKTNTRILVGQNGRIWISGDNAHIAAEVILFVEENSVMRGLTNKVEEYLNEKIKR